MIYPVDLDTAHVLTLFEFPAELRFGRLNPKYTRLYRPRAKLRRTIGRVCITRQPSYFRCVSQFVSSFARLPPGVRFFRRCAHCAPPMVTGLYSAFLARNESTSERGMSNRPQSEIGFIRAA